MVTLASACSFLLIHDDMIRDRLVLVVSTQLTASGPFCNCKQGSQISLELCLLVFRTHNSKDWKCSGFGRHLCEEVAVQQAAGG